MSEATLGALIRDARKMKNLSLDAVSDAARCAKSTLWEIEHDTAQPSFRTVVRISRALGLDLSVLAAAQEAHGHD